MDQRDIPVLDDRFEEDSVTLSTADFVVPAIAPLMGETVELDPQLKRLLIFGWEFSPAIQVLISDAQSQQAIANSLLLNIPERFSVVRMAAPLQTNITTLVTELAAEWGVALTRGRPIDVSVLLNRMERGQRGGPGYFLLLENADQLSEVHWQFLRSLAEAGHGLVRVLLLGTPMLRSCCERYFEPFGLESRLIDLDQFDDSVHQPVAAAASAVPLVVRKPPSPWPKRIVLLAALCVVPVWLIIQQPQLLGLSGGDESREPATTLTLPAVGNTAEPVAAPVKELPLVSETPVAEVQLVTAVEADPPATMPDGVAESQEPPVEVPVVSGTPTVDTRVDTAEVTQDVAPMPAPVISDKTATAADETASDAPANSVALKDGLRSDSWILAQPAGDYTLHLMSVRSEQKLRELIVEYGWQQKASYYLAHRKSGEWFVLLYGQYPSVEAAQKDKVVLSKKLKVSDALIRKFDTFQRDITSR